MLAQQVAMPEQRRPLLAQRRAMLAQLVMLVLQALVAARGRSRSVIRGWFTARFSPWLK